MSKLIRNICVCLFPVSAFWAFTSINFNMMTSIKYSRLTISHTIVYGIIIILIMGLESMALYWQLKSKAYFSNLSIVIGIIQCVLLPFICFFPSVLRKLHFSLAVYYENIGLNVWICLNILTMYIFLLIIRKTLV